MTIEDLEAEIGIASEFTYEERLVLLVYIQWQLELITEEVYITEIKRLGFTVEKLGALFKSKAESLQKYD